MLITLNFWTCFQAFSLIGKRVKRLRGSISFGLFNWFFMTLSLLLLLQFQKLRLRQKFLVKPFPSLIQSTFFYYLVVVPKNLHSWSHITLSSLRSFMLLKVKIFPYLKLLSLTVYLLELIRLFGDIMRLSKDTHSFNLKISYCPFLFL